MKRLQGTVLTTLALLGAASAQAAEQPWLDQARRHKPSIKPTATPKPVAESAEQLKLRWYTEQIKAHPQNAELHYQLGLLHLSAGKIQEAAESFKAAYRLDASQRPALRQAAMIYLRQKQHQEALNLLTPALEAWGVDPDLHYLQGLALHQAGNKAEALLAFERAATLQPGHLAVSARDALRTQVSSFKSDDPVPLRKQIQAAKADQAIPLLQNLLHRHPAEKAAYAQLAGILEGKGQFAAAAPWREQLQSLDGCYADNPAKLGRWLLWTGYLDRAASLLQQQLECRPNVDAARWLGQVHLKRQNFEAALSHYQAQIKIWPGDAELLTGLANARYGLGRYSESRATLAQIKSPGPEALYLRSQLALLAGQPEAAIKDLRAAVAASSRPEYRKALGMALAQAGQGEAARLELTKYLQVRPAEAAALQPLLESLKQLPRKGKWE